MKNKFLWLIVFLLLFVSTALAEPMKMMSYLAGAKYGSVIKKAHPDGWGAAFFTEKKIFGEPDEVINDLLAEGHTPIIKLNTMWKDDHNFKPSDFKAILAEVKRLLPLMHKYPRITFYINYATEHNYNKQNADSIIKQILAIVPANVQVINNPYTGALVTPTDRVLNEVHGPSAKVPQGRFSFDYDGIGTADSNVTKTKDKFRNAEIISFWEPQFNCRVNANDKTPRPQRKGCATVELIQAVAYLWNNKGPTDFPGKRLWKALAERHNTPPESRAHKPVVLVPEKVQKLELLTDNGKVIASSGPAQPYVDGRNRYYFNEYGHVLSEKAIKAHGNPRLRVRAGKKIIGKVNPAFRDGDA